MDKFEDCVLLSHPTGSRYICNPPVLNTDNDVVFLVNGYWPWQAMLINAGWEKCGDYEFADKFEAFRKGEDNYIVTEDEEFFKRYIHATEAAKALNLTNKEDRIKLFQAVASASSGVLGFNDFKNQPAPAANFDALFDIEAGPAPHWGKAVAARLDWEEGFREGIVFNEI